MLWLPHPDNVNHWLAGYHDGELRATIIHSSQDKVCMRLYRYGNTYEFMEIVDTISNSTNSAEHIKAIMKAMAETWLDFQTRE